MRLTRCRGTRGTRGGGRSCLACPTQLLLHGLRVGLDQVGQALEELTLSDGQEEPKASPLAPADFERLADELAPDLR